MAGANGTKTAQSRKTKAVLLAEQEALRERVVELETALEEREHAEAALRKGKQLFDDLFEGSIQGIVIQREYKALFVNQAYADIHGYGNPREIMGLRSLLDLVAPHEHDRFRAYKKARETGADAPARYDFQGRRKDGTNIWLESVVTEIDWHDGPAILVTITDIDERRRAEQALRQSEMRFRSFVENMRNIIFCHGVAGDGDHGYDAEGIAVFGKNAPALAGTVIDGMADLDCWFRQIHPDDREMCEEAERRRKTDGKDFTIEYRFYHPETNELRWVQECGWVVADAQTGERYFDSYLLDITDHKFAEEALITNEQRFRDFAEAASDWFWEMDENLRFSYLSERAKDIAGVPPEDLHGKSRKDMALPDVEPEKWAAHQAILDAHKPFRDFIYRRPDRDGNIMHVKTSGVPVFDDHGVFKGYRGVGANITAELQAHEALYASEARLKAIIDNAPVLIALKDIQGHCVLANRHYAAMYGMAEEQVIGTTVYDLFDKAEADRYWAHEQRVLESGEASVEEFLNQTVEGERYLLETKFPIFDEAGEIVGLGFIGADISSRKRAEERFRQYFDLPLVGAAVTSPKRQWLEVNDRLCEILGYSREELLGMTCADITHPDDLEESRAFFDAACANERDSYSLEKRYIRKDGQSIYTTTSTQCIRRADGILDYLITLFQDITERKTAEQALRFSEQRVRNFAEISSDWFWEMDQNLRFSFFSERLTAVTGLDPAQFLGKTRAEVGQGNIREDKWRRHLADLEAHRGFRDFRYTYTGDDGRQHQWSIGGTPVFDDNGQFTGYRGTTTDVTAQEQAFKGQKAAMEQAEAANRAKSEFLANMSHELRTPLNAIIGFSEIMKDELLGQIGGTHYRQYAKDIHDSGSHLLSLINDILDLSKIEAGKFELEEEDIDIAEAVEASVRLVQPRADEGKLHLELDLRSDLPFLRADLRAFKQIMLNLLSNAVKFTQPGGCITVSAHVDKDGRPSVSVADTGIGMAAEHIEIAMSSFGQVDSPYARHHQGTGLGLPMVRALVKLHDGSLEVESELGAGTTTTVRMPVERVVSRRAGRSA